MANGLEILDEDWGRAIQRIIDSVLRVRVLSQLNISSRTTESLRVGETRSYRVAVVRTTMKDSDWAVSDFHIGDEGR